MRAGICLSTFAALYLLGSGSALACICGVIPTQITEYGDLIAEGEVLSVDTVPGNACIAAASEMRKACPDQADLTCRAPYLERLKGCPDALPMSFESTAVLKLSNVWKGPNTESLTLEYSDGSSCGVTLIPGERIALIAHRSDSGGWTTDVCGIGKAGSFSRTDNEFGAVAHPLLVAYRAEGEEIAKKVAADPDSIDVALALAAYQEKGGYVDTALATYRGIVTRAPRTKTAYLAMVRLLMTKPKLFEALDVAREGLAHIPDDPDLVKFLTDRGFKPKKSN
jgi:hypothetical protein